MSKQSKKPSASGQHTTAEDQVNQQHISNAETEAQNENDDEDDNDEAADDEEDSSDSETVDLPPSGRVNAPIIYQLEILLDFVHPRRLKSDLISVLLQYLVHESDNLSIDFKETAENYLLLFGWLDFVEKEMDERGFEP